MPLHGGGTRRSESWQSVRSGWPLAISLFPFSPCYPLSLPRRTLSAAVVSRVPSFPVPISLRNLSRINWFDPDVSSRETPIGHCSHAARLVRLLIAPLPALLPPRGTRTTLFLVPPRSQIFAKVTWPNGPRVTPRREGSPRGREGNGLSVLLTNHSRSSGIHFRDSANRRFPERALDWGGAWQLIEREPNAELLRKPLRCRGVNFFEMPILMLQYSM